ncbi:NAD-P-binding protein [Laetiporus sulphureus 93-53]|uniref:NAD-P-binding protein n=1 Tax=Laetiporus sulphureus 93-53 TaxID=1314785 RepID=A0A165GWE4_9APHY|nr:NAD-P-binding protein [Laetiporus sulphureus 93-53]KZT10917.1 NAD-P-binding protein [Laetiporus sulphureus 93-53]
MSGAVAVKQAFLSSPQFAVVGASKDPSKYGTKVLQWYLEREKTVTPVHPKENEIQGVQTIRSLEELPDPAHTSISIVTPAKVTLGLLEQAKKLNVPAVWLQPGAEDDAVIAYINENGLADRTIYGGPCILVEGDGILKSVL